VSEEATLGIGARASQPRVSTDPRVGVAELSGFARAAIQPRRRLRWLTKRADAIATPVGVDWKWPDW